MPVITCPECGHHPLSTFAECCPSCKAPVSTLLNLLSESAATSEIGNDSGSIQKQSGPQLDIERIIDEFLSLSRPNASPHTGYLSALQRSQICYWSILAQNGSQDATFLMACTEIRPEGVCLEERLRSLCEKQHMLSLWVAGDNLAWEGGSATPKGLRMLKLAADGGVEIALHAYAYHLESTSDQTDDPQYGSIPSEIESIMDALSRSSFPPSLYFLGSLRLRRAKYSSSRSEQQAMIHEGIRLLTRSAELGCEDAAKKLSDTFDKGRYVERNQEDAERWQMIRDRLRAERRKPKMSAYGIRDLVEAGALKSDSLLICREQ